MIQVSLRASHCGSQMDPRNLHDSEQLRRLLQTLSGEALGSPFRVVLSRGLHCMETMSLWALGLSLTKKKPVSFDNQKKKNTDVKHTATWVKECRS